MFCHSRQRKTYIFKIKIQNISDIQIKLEETKVGHQFLVSQFCVLENIIKETPY